MKPTLSFVFLVALAFGLGACSTVKSRVKEKQSVFNSLSPVDQANVQQGVVEIGYSMDMVYMALGKADRVKDQVTNGKTKTSWIYNQYYQEYVGTRFVGYRRDMFYDGKNKIWRVYYTPVSQDVYRDRVNEVARVVFVDGRVESVEQVQ